jgi:hypothetical protein
MMSRVGSGFSHLWRPTRRCVWTDQTKSGIRQLQTDIASNASTKEVHDEAEPVPFSAGSDQEIPYITRRA